MAGGGDRVPRPGDAPESAGESASVRRLLELLGEARCLLVLDNFETVLQPGGPVRAISCGLRALRHAAPAGRGSATPELPGHDQPRGAAGAGPLRGERGPVRIHILAGLRVEDGRALLSDKRLDGDDAAWQALVGRYGGNGLALKVVGETTRELFGGSIADYLEYATATAGVMVGGVRQLLGAQIQRLSDLEQELLRRMAVEREPVGIAELAADLGPRIGRAATLEAVEGLRRRSLLERNVDGQPLYRPSRCIPLSMELVTEQVIEELAQELARGEPWLVCHVPVVRATTQGTPRRSQSSFAHRSSHGW